MNNNPSWNQADFRQYAHTFHTVPPAIPIQSFAQQGYAPFGNVVGASPEIFVPTPVVGEETQPVYYVKVTATPVQISDHVEGTTPEYVVSAHPDVKGRQQSVLSRDGERVIAHATPTIHGVQTRGISIHPLHYEQSLRAEKMQKEANRLQSGTLSENFVPEETIADGRESGDIGALVHVYGGSTSARPEQVLTAAQARGAISTERGFSRGIPRPLDMDDFGQPKEKIYSWIIPTTKDVEAVEELVVENDGSSKHVASSVDASGKKISVSPSKASQMFQQTSFSATGYGEEEEFADGASRKPGVNGEAYGPYQPQFLSTPTDDELGLPEQLRPSVVYGGVEHAPPEFAGQKGALKYKLHAIEVHQYVPIPDAQEPWIIQQKLNPTIASIFGPMPLPFDPVNSGMVAPTFQKTIGLQPTPVLSPEFTKMFNHELPVLSIMRDTLPEAETA